MTLKKLQFPANFAFKKKQQLFSSIFLKTVRLRNQTKYFPQRCISPVLLSDKQFGLVQRVALYISDSKN